MGLAANIRTLLSDDLETRISRLENPAIPLSEGGLLSGTGEFQDLPVNPISILRIPAVEAAVAIISETIAGAPINVMDISDLEKPEIAEDHPVQIMLQGRMNKLMGRMRFIETMTRAALVYGNAVAEIVRGEEGLPAELNFLQPSKLSIKASPDGRSLQYVYNYKLGAQRIFTPDEVLHLVGPSNGGYTGYNVADEFKEIWLHMLYAQRYGLSFFKNNGRPSGVLVADTPLNDDQRARNKRAWEQAHSGDKAQGTAVLQNTQYQAVQTSPDEAQFLDTQRFAVYETARIFNLPVTKLRDNERSTYNNLLEESIDFRRETIEPWTRRWQEAFDLAILGEFRGKMYTIEFQLDHLTQRDQLERMQGYKIAIDAGIMSPQEARNFEGWGDMPPELVEQQEMEKEAAKKALEDPPPGKKDDSRVFAGGVTC